MFFGVIGSAMILLAGHSLERFLAPVRAIVAYLAASLVIRALLIDSTVLGSASMAALSHALAGGSRIGLIIVLLGAGALALLSHRLSPKLTMLASEIVLISSLAFIILLAAGVPVTPVSRGVLGGATGLGALTWFLLDRDRYRIWTTAVVGATMVSFLFTRFYYFPTWLFIVLSLGLAVIGISVQKHSSRRDLAEKEKP